MFNFEQFAVKRAQSNNRVSIKDLTVEQARAEVKVVDGNIKRPVEGFQGLTLKLSRVKLELAGVAGIPAGTAKLQVPNDQVEEVSAQLLQLVEAGEFDAAIEAGLVRLNTVEKKEAPVADEGVSDEDFFADDEGGFEE